MPGSNAMGIDMTEQTARAEDAAAAKEGGSSATPPAAPAEANPTALAAELKDKLLRTLAEMENLRKRTAREVTDARVYGVSSFARDILAVAEPRSRRADLVAAVRAIEASGDPLTVRDLAVSGNDLQAAGLQPGKAMGEILRKLLEEVLDEPWRNTREHLVARAKELS